MLPVIGNRSIPPTAKIGLAAFLSILLVSMMKGAESTLPNETFSFVLIIMKEVVVGLTLGFITKFILVGVQMAGEIVGVQMGFGVARVMDPGFQAQLSIIAEIKVYLVLIFYLVFNGHHFLIRGLFESFEAIPLARGFVGNGIEEHVISMAAGIFKAAVKIGAPVIISLLLMNVALGVIARTVPQMNIFIIGLPARLVVGFLALMVTISLFVHLFRTVWGGFQKEFSTFIYLF